MWKVRIWKCLHLIYLGLGWGALCGVCEVGEREELCSSKIKLNQVLSKVRRQVAIPSTSYTLTSKAV